MYGRVSAVIPTTNKLLLSNTCEDHKLSVLTSDAKVSHGEIDDVPTMLTHFSVGFNAVIIITITYLVHGIPQHPPNTIDPATQSICVNIQVYDKETDKGT